PPALHSFPTRRSSDLLVLARVHHREFDIGHGLTSTHAMAIFIGLFLFAVLTLRVLAWHFRLDGALLRWALFAFAAGLGVTVLDRSEEHTSELQSRENL